MRGGAGSDGAVGIPNAIGSRAHGSRSVML
ncbi:hypothetical protein SLEX105133_05535 [Slackia exigua]|nr:Uncharacterised protein [Slackia exigua]